MIWIVCLIEFVIGAILHFTYDILPYNIVALIVPVNESIFEHLKLVLYPMLLIDIVLWYRYYHKDKCILTPMLIGIVIGILSVVLIYYFYRYGLGIESLIADIVLLFISICIGNLVMIMAYQHHWHIDDRIVICLVLAIIVFFSIVTFFPPDIPVFIDKSQ